MPPVLTPSAPGTGPGWDQLAPVVAAEIPSEAIDGVWVFRVVRSGGHDWGTAVISRVEGDRRRIYTARFTLAVKGRKRGAFEASVHEVGSGPLEALEELLALVPRRADEDDPLIPVEVAHWFPELQADASPEA